ncbi:clathrin adaptor mu subunit [Lactarius akahatsu]|uniref:Clathrin adaptor mu subunit n=1 Tax=Lactarius akahatsu TaxID=416441 RepID=A0AAD4LB38_9AGAM|nr:clathrin adaptor mu subunit [Lactarius akahatsu]
MAIDGLIVLDSANARPIVQTSFRSFPPAYPLLHINAYSSAVAKAVRPEDVDPVLLVTLPDEPTACCHLQHRSLTFLCPISGDLDPLYAFTFIRTFLNILIEYFGEVTAPVLRDNFDIVHQLLEETLDAGGHPLTTAPNALRDIVLPPSLISKILSVTGVTGPSGPSTNNLSAFSSPIPWRKAGLRYNHNDIYFDIVETLDAVVNKNGTIITSSVLGKVDVNCKLSGTPDLLLTLTNSHTISEPSFHPCVRLNRFAQSKALSFVPPDGRFTLMEYRFDPSASKPGAAPALTAAAAAQLQVQVPFTLRASLSITDHGGAFELSFTPRAGALEDVAVELYLGSGATGATCTCRKWWQRVDVRARAAHAALVPRALRLRNPRCHPFRLRAGYGARRCGARSRAGMRTRAPRARRRYRSRCLQGALLSALKIDQLKLSGETYKPYKGVRGRALGRVEWRVEWKGG